MERDPFAEPESEPSLADRARELGRKLIGLCSYFPESGYPSDHGAAAMLDRALECPDEVEAPIRPTKE